MLQLDGSYGEGGGQIIRTSLSLAAITGQAVAISNVRAGRSKPGLQPQHLMAVRAAAALCGARLEGDHVGSTRLAFKPQQAVQPGEHRFDIGTAGATTLVAQTVLLPLALAGGASRVVITGGTHVPHAPTTEYLERVYLPALRRMSVEARLVSPRAGFFPKGGGELEIDIDGLEAGRLTPVDFTERGKLRSLAADVITAGLPDHVGERGQAAIEQFLKGVGRRADIAQRRPESWDPGAAVFLAAECEGGLAGFTALGQRGKLMQVVAPEACQEFMDWWKTGAAVDAHLADQLVLPAALAAPAGESRWTAPEVTEHLRTVLWVAGQFLPIRTSIEAAGGVSRVTLAATR